MGKPFDLLLGRKTYEIFAAHWPHVDDPGAEQLNSARKYVASRTLDSVEWSNSTLLEGDVAEAVARIKEEDGPEIQVHGSSDLIRTLLERDLVDEFRIMIFPVVLGTGKRLFAEGAPPAGLSARRVRDLRDRRSHGDVQARGRHQVRLVRARGADRGGARAPQAARRGIGGSATQGATPL